MVHRCKVDDQNPPPLGHASAGGFISFAWGVRL